MTKLEFVDSRTARDADGREYDVLKAIGALPWVSQLCPQMPHQYAVHSKSPDWAWDVLEAMVKSSNPDSYRAYFRGYQTPNRYWEAPDGLRYWRTRELNRCRPDSVEPLRRVADGAKPVKDWDGPLYAPNGSGLYVRDAKGRWWPTGAALEGGYQPFRACQHGKKPPSAISRQPPDARSTIAPRHQGRLRVSTSPPPKRGSQ